MKRKLKTLVQALCLAFAALAISSCALFSGDKSDVHDLIDNTMKIFKFAENSDAASFADQATIDSLSAYGVDANEFLAYCFKNLEWEIGDIKLSGNTGTVALTVTNVNLGTALERAGERFDQFADTDEAQELFISDGEGALVQKLFDYFYEVIDSGELETTTNEVTVEVYKTDEGEWDIDSDNSAFYSALYGGAQLNL